MRFFKLIHIIIWQTYFSSIVHTLSEDPIEMDVWEDKKAYPAFNWDRTISKTWHKVIDLRSFVAEKDTYGYEDALYIAKRCHAWLRTQANAATDTTNTVLVSAMLDSETSQVFVSSIPRGPAFSMIRAAAKNTKKPAAPIWWAKKSLLNRSKRVLHAEDGVLFDWESNVGDSRTRGAWPYPKGLIFAVVKAQGNGPVLDSSPCEICQPLLNSLGVAYKNKAGLFYPQDGVPPAPPQNPSMSEPEPGTSEPEPGPSEPDPSTDDNAYPDNDADEIAQYLLLQEQLKNAGCGDLDPFDYSENEEYMKRSLKRGKADGIIPRHARRATSQFGSSCAIHLPFSLSSTPSRSRTQSHVSFSGLGPLPSTYQLPSSFITTTTITMLPLSSAPSSASMSTPTTLSSNSAVSSSGTISPTLTPTLSCSMQDAEPPQLPSANCVCDGSITLPLLKVVSPTIVTQSCAYTALPSGSAISAIITAKPTLGPATTNSYLCQVCTQVNANENTCSSITGCTVQSARATLTAGSSPVHVGTLTASALSSQVSSALKAICPSPTSGVMTSCTPTAQVTLGPIPYIEGKSLRTNGELIVKVESSGYNLTSLRDAMINSIAASTQQGATGKNCYNATYETEYQPIKRTVDILEHSMSNFSKRLDIGAPILEERSMVMCNTNWFATANYYNMFWHTDDVTSPSAWISADYTFHVPPPSGLEFICALVDDLITAFEAIEPEFIVEDVGLEEAINFFCGEHPEDA